MMNLLDITIENNYWTKVNKIFPGIKERYWVDYNSWWYRKSIQKKDIYCQLIEYNSNIVGIIAYGQHYADKKLTQKIENTAEIYHIVMDKKYQNSGLGFKICQTIIQALITKHKFKTIVIAHHTDNVGAKKLFEKLRFQSILTKNYDGDQMMKFEYNSE
jgi:RimJ/RimL family protein N-acetyltransferase